jgi:hypothetical protein
MKIMERIILSKWFWGFFGAVSIIRFVSYYLEPEENREPAQVVNGFVETDGLRCQSVVDFGRLPIVNGVSIGERTIQIHNTSNADIEILPPEPSCKVCTKITTNGLVVPAQDNLSFVAKIILPPHDFNKQQIGVVIKQKDKNKKRLEMTLQVKSAFTIFARQRTLDFGTVFIGKTAKLPLEIAYPWTSEQNDFVKSVRISNGSQSGLKIVKTEYQSRRLKDSLLETIFMNLATIFVELEHNINQQTGAGFDELIVETSQGTKLKIPVSWKFGRKQIFEPDESRHSLVALTLNEIREFLIIYNSDAGGMPIKIRTTGAGLSITKTQKDGDTVYIKLRYSAGAKPPHGKLGELVVETAAGNKTCAIVAD